ncbi:Uncharacterised protein [Mycobacterium tuberculosis]|nr:Uncharacterised protein [Mycobacterium tuberculosis]
MPYTEDAEFQYASGGAGMAAMSGLYAIWGQGLLLTTV